MNQRVVAVFEDRSDAEDARQELIDAGFSESQIDIKAQAPEEQSALGQYVEEERRPIGFWERIQEFFGMNESRYYEEASRRGMTLVAVDVPEARVDDVSDILSAHDPVDLDEHAAEWRQSGWTGGTTTPTQATGMGAKTTGTTKGTTGTPPAASGKEGEESIPVVEEQLRIDKERRQSGGVRVYSRVTEQPVSRDVTLEEETVNVERRKADRPASGADFREQTVEATEFREEPVVSKEARIVEEVVISKQRGRRTQKVEDTVRRTDVEVQELEKDYRRDFEQRYGQKGYTYDQSRAAYSYGQQLADMPEYRGRDWNAVESDARTHFEKTNPGRWDEFKDAIRHAYERATMRKAA